MRKFSRIAAVCLALIMALTMMGVSGPAMAKDGKKLPKYTFVLIPKLVHPWFDDVRIGAENCAKWMKESGIANVKIQWYAPPQADLPTQIQFMENAISRRPDGIAISVMEESGCNKVIDQAVEMGIPVTTFCTDAPASKRSFFVGRKDTTQDGMILGELLAKKLGYKGEVGVLVGSLGAPDHKHRAEGFRKVMAKYPDIKIVSEQPDNDDVELAANMTENMLSAFPNLKGIYAADATAPIGAANAVTAADKAGKIIIVGQDDLPDTVEYIKKDVIDTVIIQRVREIGWWTCFNLWAIDNGHQVPEMMDINVVKIDKSNLDAREQFK